VREGYAECVRCNRSQDGLHSSLYTQSLHGMSLLVMPECVPFVHETAPSSGGNWYWGTVSPARLE